MSLTGRAGRRLPRVGFRCGHGCNLLRAAGTLYEYRYRRSIYSFLLYSLTNSHPITSSPSRARASNSSWPPADDPTRGGEPSRLGGLGARSPYTHQQGPEGRGGKGEKVARQTAKNVFARTVQCSSLISSSHPVGLTITIHINISLRLGLRR